VDNFSALVASLLIGVFIYWGWESAVNLTEETTDSTRAPGLAAVVSTLVLLVTYVAVTTAVVAYGGLVELEGYADDESIFAVLGVGVLGTPWDKIVVLAIVISAISSTQTTIIPASRTTFSMGRAGAFPDRFADVHPRFRTPAFSTIVVAAAATAWYVPANFISENFLFDTLSALSLMIAFYYALSGLACVVYYRHELLRSAKNFLFIGVAPFVGAASFSTSSPSRSSTCPTPRTRTRARPGSASGPRLSSASASSCSVSSCSSSGGLEGTSGTSAAGPSRSSIPRSQPDG
jgi:amino acid transporter